MPGKKAGVFVITGHLKAEQSDMCGNGVWLNGIKGLIGLNLCGIIANCEFALLEYM